MTEEKFLELAINGLKTLDIGVDKLKSLSFKYESIMEGSGMIGGHYVVRPKLEIIFK